ncbi:MAG TPA: peptidoglycan DD-metalloendopeptidase family protein [Planctomycetota bacterium]|nr:peptidoglycan DD-metalloendopeptidase family protein [Planctomycetota bacterium]
MRFIMIRAVPAALFLLAGCNGATRTPPPGTTARVRPADPQFQADLKRYEEQRVTWHTIKKGETFFSLSRQYGVPVAAIAAANPHVDQSKISVGEKVAVPGYGAATGPTPAPQPPDASPLGPKPSAVKTRDVGRFRYPVAGTAVQAKGPTPGVEFAVPVGAAVMAADAGKVVLASPDLGGLGPTVIVDHGGGLCTLYGRMADFAVKPDQKVGRGEAIGRCGAVRFVFRVYDGPVARDPAGYLNRK